MQDKAILAELIQLKKDILWTYDEHYHAMDNVMIPSDDFCLDYHKYLLLDKEDFYNDDDYNFYINGTLVILLGICIEYIDTLSGDSKTLKRIGINNVEDVINKFTPSQELQSLLKSKILLGLEIAAQIKEEDFLKDEEYYHEKSPSFFNNIYSITDTVIENYYDQKFQK